MGCFYVLGLLFALAVLLMAYLLKSPNFMYNTAKMWCGGFAFAASILLAANCLIFIFWEISSTGSVIITTMEEGTQKYLSGMFEKKEEYEELVECLNRYDEAVKMARERPGNWWDGKLLEKFENREMIGLPEGFTEDYLEIIEKSVNITS